jgi:hypothetical protein
VNDTRKESIRKALRTPMTVKDLSDVVFLTERGTQKVIKRMREDGQVYIKSWQRTGGKLAPVYALGNKADAPKLEARSGYERVKRSRTKESSEDRDFRLARQRAKNRKIKVHPLMAAFYGASKPPA